MKIEDMTVGVTYAFNRDFSNRFCDFKTGDRVKVVGKDLGKNFVSVFSDKTCGVIAFETSYFDPVSIQDDVEAALRKKIAAEILTYWPTKQGIAAMVEVGPEVYFKLKGN